MRSLILKMWGYIFGRREFEKFNLTLFHLSLRGLGFLIIIITRCLAKFLSLTKSLRKLMRRSIFLMLVQIRGSLVFFASEKIVRNQKIIHV